MPRIDGQVSFDFNLCAGAPQSFPRDLVSVVHSDIMDGNVNYWALPGTVRFTGVTEGSFIKFLIPDVGDRWYKVVKFVYYRNLGHAWNLKSVRALWEGALPKVALAIQVIFGQCSLGTSVNQFTRNVMQGIFGTPYTFSQHKEGIVTVTLEAAVPACGTTDLDKWPTGQCSATLHVPESVELDLMDYLADEVAADRKLCEIRVGFASTSLANLEPYDFVTLKSGTRVIRLRIVGVDLFGSHVEFIEREDLYYQLFPSRSALNRPYSVSAFKEALRGSVCNNVGFNKITTDKILQADAHGWIIVYFQRLINIPQGVVWQKRTFSAHQRLSVLHTLQLQKDVSTRTNDGSASALTSATAPPARQRGQGAVPGAGAEAGSVLMNMGRASPVINSTNSNGSATVISVVPGSVVVQSKAIPSSESASSDAVVLAAPAIVSTGNGVGGSDNDEVTWLGQSKPPCPFVAKRQLFLSSYSYLHRNILIGQYVSMDRTAGRDRVLSLLGGHRDSTLSDLFHPQWRNPSGIGNCLILVVLNVWVFSKFSSMHYDYDTSIIKSARISMFFHAFVGCMGGNSKKAVGDATDELNDSAFCIAESLYLTGRESRRLRPGPNYMYLKRPNSVIGKAHNGGVMCNPTISEFYTYLRSRIVESEADPRPWLDPSAVVLLQEINKDSPRIAVWDTTVERATLDANDCVFGSDWGVDGSHSNFQSIIRNGGHFLNLIRVTTPDLADPVISDFGRPVCLDTHYEITKFLLEIFVKSIETLLAETQFSTGVLELMNADLVTLKSLTQCDPGRFSATTHHRRLTSLVEPAGTIADDAHLSSASYGSTSVLDTGVLDFMRVFCAWPKFRHDLQTKGLGGFMEAPSQSRRQWTLFPDLDSPVVVTGVTNSWKDRVVFHLAPGIVLGGNLCSMQGDGLCNGHGVLYITLCALDTSRIPWSLFKKLHPHLVPVFAEIVSDAGVGRTITLSNLWKQIAPSFRTSFLPVWVKTQYGVLPESDLSAIDGACRSGNMSLLNHLYTSDNGSTLGQAFQAFVNMYLHTLQVQEIGVTIDLDFMCSISHHTHATPLMCAARRSALVNWTEIDGCALCERTHARHYDVLENIEIYVSEDQSIPLSFDSVVNLFPTKHLSVDAFNTLTACPLRCLGAIEPPMPVPVRQTRRSASTEPANAVEASVVAGAAEADSTTFDVSI
jgi:hypothetical protein